MADEQLSQLELEAQAIDAEMNQEIPQPEAAPQPSLNADYQPIIVKGLMTAVGVGDKLIPFTSRFYDEAAVNDIAQSIVKVADVEQIELKKIFGDPNSRIGAWVTLAISVGFPGFMFVLALKEYNKTKPGEPNEKEVKGEVVQPSGEEKPQAERSGFHA